MKNALIFCALYFVTIFSYADTCPEMGGGYEFRVAAWGDHVNSTSKVRCHYYFYKDPAIHKEFVTTKYYYESNIIKYPNWDHSSNGPYHLCVSTNIYDW